jgi:glycosyltransferase involved in cell wall biosynthesis
VVATPLACQGVPAENGANLLLGKSPEELARATCDLLADRVKRQALADRGRETVARELTWDAAAARLSAAFGG